MNEKRFNIVDGDAENYLLNLLMFSFANRLHKYLYGFPKFKSTSSSFEVAADKPCFKLFLTLIKNKSIVANIGGYAMCTNSKPSKLKVQNLREDLWKHLWSCRSLAQGYWSCTLFHWNNYSHSYTYAKIHLAFF